MYMDTLVFKTSLESLLSTQRELHARHAQTAAARQNSNKTPATLDQCK